MFGINYGQTKPLVHLISIGIVGEDNREYYAISKDFNLEEAWNRYEVESYDKQNNLLSKPRKVYWIRENVLFPIWVELYCKDKNLPFEVVNKYKSKGVDFTEFTYKKLKRLLNKYGKTNKQIAEEIKDYISDKRKLDTGLIDQYGFTYNALKTFEGRMRCIEVNWGLPQFYAYYGAFDYVAFSQIFGGFESYPKSFPQYFIDLKQELDGINSKGKSLELSNSLGLTVDEILKIHKQTGEIHFKEINNFTNIETHPKYPKEPTTHHALSDAHWNKQLHEFLNTL
jgi:hypothetical protein